MLFKWAITSCHKILKIQFLLPCNEITNGRAFSSIGNSKCQIYKLLSNKINTRERLHYKQKRELSFNAFTNFIKKIIPKMDEVKKLGVFRGELDRFNGITVDSKAEYDAKSCFEDKLQKSLDYWKNNERRAIWFKVRSEHAEWIPVLTQYEFDFHHAGQGFATLRRWLPENEYSNIPDYAHSLVGVGGLVINQDTMEVLVVTDRYAAIPGSWKLPGGYVDPKENLIDAVIREVKEETGIEANYRTMVSLRHSHGGNFGCSDLYFVIALFSKTVDVIPCEREIARVCWMPIAEYLSHPNVHETNRHTMKTYLDYERRGLRLDCLSATHQILKKEYQIFYTRALDENEKIKVPSEEELEKTCVKVEQNQ